MRKIQKGIALLVSVVLFSSLFSADSASANINANDGQPAQEDLGGIEIISVEPYQLDENKQVNENLPGDTIIINQEDSEAKEVSPEQAGSPKYPVNAQKINSNSISRAALVDLAVLEIECLNTQPIDYWEEPEFKIYFYNYGPDTATTVYFGAYIDGSYLGSIPMPTPIAPDIMYECTFTLGGLQRPGSHSLQITINNNTLGEADATDNQLSRNFTWTDAVDLLTYDLRHAAGLTTVEAMVSEVYKIQVENIGNLTSTSQMLYLQFDGKSAGQMPLALNIPPNYGYTVSFSFALNKSGATDVTCSVSSDNGNDPITMNNYATTRFHATQDTCIDERWQDATSLHYAILSRVSQYISFADCEAAIKAWNNISPNVNISVSASTNLAQDSVALQQYVNTYVNVEDYYQDTETIAYCISNNYPNGYRAWARIFLCVPNFTNFSSDITERKGIITHEMGHALGLPHTDCLDPANMAEFVNAEHFRFTIQDHDIHNLNTTY